MWYLLQTHIIPMPVGYSGGGISRDGIIGLWLALNIFIICGMMIRYAVIKKDKRYNNQSHVKNFFYELEDNDIEEQKRLSKYSWGEYMKSDINIWALGLITYNSVAAIVLLASFISNI